MLLSRPPCKMNDILLVGFTMCTAELVVIYAETSSETIWLWYVNQRYHICLHSIWILSSCLQFPCLQPIMIFWCFRFHIHLALKCKPEIPLLPLFYLNFKFLFTICLFATNFNILVVGFCRELVVIYTETFLDCKHSPIECMLPPSLISPCCNQLWYSSGRFHKVYCRELVVIYAETFQDCKHSPSECMLPPSLISPCCNQLRYFGASGFTKCTAENWWWYMLKHS